MSNREPTDPLELVWAGPTSTAARDAVDALAAATIGATIGRGFADAAFGVYVVPRYARRARAVLASSAVADGVVGRTARTARIRPATALFLGVLVLGLAGAAYALSGG